MTRPELSLVMVTCGRPRSLEKALGSAFSQDLEDLEVVVVVNGDDPETRSVLARHASPRLSTVMLDRNQGVSAGRNVGLVLARSAIVFFLDDDAYLSREDTARRVLERFRSAPELGILGLLVTDPAGNTERACVPFRDKTVPRDLSEACLFPGGACAIRRSVFEKIGRYDEGLFYSGEELDLSYSALEAGVSIRFDPAISIVHEPTSAGPSREMPLYFYPRNRPLVALRHLPLRYFVTHCAAWWSWSLVRACLRGRPDLALRGILDCVRGIPAHLRARRPVSRATMRILSRNKGRLWW
jgi:hypothetical protein